MIDCRNSSVQTDDINERYIVINEVNDAGEYKGKGFAIPFQNYEQALAFYREFLLRIIPRAYGYEPGDKEYEELKSVDEDFGIPGIVMCHEGKLGEWTGFCSSDCDSIYGELPFTDEDDFIGDGDPNLYLTGEQPSGMWIPAIPSINESNKVHPLYQQHLDFFRTPCV